MKDKIAELKDQLERVKAAYNIRRGELNRLLALQKEKSARLEEIRARSELLEKVRLLLQQAAEHARENARQQLEYSVTQALQFVFGQDLEFKVIIQERRNQPEAEFLVTSTYGGQYRIETPPEDARGGGIVDVISLALRLALLEMVYPKPEGPVILDEPAKHVSDEFVENVARFLKSVSQSFGRQVILVTHNPHLAQIADRAFHIEMRDGRSEVRVLNPGS
ncbi:MAG: ATP-binding protein [Clostridia bacterium]|nr:ATP-binding protein [Clostridia bacterium]